MIKTFPSVPSTPPRRGEMDVNPGILLFGRRFFGDQTNLELLIEFLLVGTSRKRLGSSERRGGYVDEESTSDFLPPSGFLSKLKDVPLEYAPKARLNLKLFSFFGASRVDSRHETHREHLQELDLSLQDRIESCEKPENVAKTLESLFLGFHGEGGERTWCAQSFLPLCPELIASESMWKSPQSKKGGGEPHFSQTDRLFLARGGEVLYLQLCNALSRDPQEISSWLDNSWLRDFLSEEEQDPKRLYGQLQSLLPDIFIDMPKAISRLANFIDNDLDTETSEVIDGSVKDDMFGERDRWIECGCCAEDTWQEGYLFGVELFRICRSRLDILERIDLLELACVLQVLRTLTTQAARYGKTAYDGVSWPLCRFAISDPEGNNSKIKLLSQESVQKAFKTIYDGLRSDSVRDMIPNFTDEDKAYKNADDGYGHKLFTKIAKRVGLIVPPQGAGMRFVFNDRLLRYLVITLVPRRRITFDRFKAAAEMHFGFCFDGGALSRANRWITGRKNESFDGEADRWLISMLEGAGCLKSLSDSCALVENSASPDFEEE